MGAALDGLAERCDSIYVDVDIDVLDRAFAPACPGARPGGMTLRDLSEGVRLCARHPQVRWIDFVEVDAEADQDGLTLDAMAHLFLSAVGGYAERDTDRANPPAINHPELGRWTSAATDHRFGGAAERQTLAMIQESVREAHRPRP